MIPVTVEFSSSIQDGLVIPYHQDKELNSRESGYYLSQNTTIHEMLNEYNRKKFPSQETDDILKIFIHLDDFWIEEYITDNETIRFLSFLGGLGSGSSTNYMLTANMFLTVKLLKDGELLTKTIFVNFENTFRTGGGGEESKSNYGGMTSLTGTHALNINHINNRAIMILNTYLEELGL
jgi:hypothetical protein